MIYVKDCNKFKNFIKKIGINKKKHIFAKKYYIT